MSALCHAYGSRRARRPTHAASGAFHGIDPCRSHTRHSVAASPKRYGRRRTDALTLATGYTGRPASFHSQLARRGIRTCHIPKRCLHPHLTDTDHRPRTTLRTPPATRTQRMIHLRYLRFAIDRYCIERTHTNTIAHTHTSIAAQ